MNLKLPKDSENYHWTAHVKSKMLQYRLSESLIKRAIRFPKRAEEGIAPATIAVMVSMTSKKPSETWVMYKKDAGRKVIISTWRYPGISPVGKRIKIPHDVLEELEKWIL